MHHLHRSAETSGLRALIVALALTVQLLALGLGAPAAQATAFGLSDQQARTWADPRVRSLGIQHARLIMPWDAATSEPERVQAWLDGVADAGLQPHIVFALLRTDRCPGTPCRLPSRAEYRAAVDAFRARWPQVTTFTTWNEANHYTQPVRDHPEAVAGFWAELTDACPGCTVVSADVLDSSGYVRWLERFKKAVPRMPRLWAIHNYADATYGSMAATDKVLSMVPGELWVEETGGIVSLRDELGRPTFGVSESRAAAAIDHAFLIARMRPRITRMYLYHWKAHTFSDLFDAGLVRPDGVERESYYRAKANIRGFASAAATPPRSSPQVSVSARWSTTDPRHLLVTVRCLARGVTCHGRATVAVEFRRGVRGRPRVVRLAAGRPYRTVASARPSSTTLRIAVSRDRRAMLRAATTRRLTIAFRALSPTASRGDRAALLPRPPKP